MQSKRNPQLEEERQVKQPRSELSKYAHGDVWQDRRAFQRARIASFQASPVSKATGAHRLDTNSDRGKKHLPRRNTVQAVGWVGRPISSLIDKKAEEWHLTRSKTID